MSDRPLFDDEELPSWLRNAGVTGGSGEQGSRSDKPSGSSSDDFSDFTFDTSDAGSGDLSWLDAASSDFGSTGSPQQGAGGDIPPWMQSAEPSSGSDSASFEQAPWMQSNESPFGEPAGSSDLPPWAESSAAPSQNLDDPFSGGISQASFGVTGALPWRQEAEQEPSSSFGSSDFSSFDFGDTANTPASPSNASGDDLSWLDDAIQESPAETPQPSAPIPPAPTVRPLSSLPSLQQNQEQPAQTSGIKKLPTMQQPPQGEQGDQPRPQIKKLSSAQPPSQSPQPQRDISDMTYEEWERSQAEAAAEAARSDEDRLLDEVPDWFKSDAPPPAPTPSASKPQAGPSGGEFMPEWFVGQEEQAHSDAPDWFKNVDLTSTPLVGTASTGDSASESPYMSSSSSEDVPDWFKDTSAAVPGIDDIDFNAMFVADTPSQPGSKLSSKFGDLTPLTPEPSRAEPPAEQFAAPEPESELSFEEPVAQELQSDSADLDWMSEMPELDDLLEVDPQQTLESTSQPASEVVTASGSSGDDLSGLLDTLDSASVGMGTQPPAQDDSLDWLSEEPAGELEGGFENFEDAAEPAEDMPDWMRGMASAPATAPSASTESTESGDDLSGLLDALGSAPSRPTPPSPAPATGDMPDWMRDMSPVSSSTPAPSAPVAGDDWMSDFAADLGELSAAQTSLKPPATNEEWMSVLADSTPASTQPPVSAQPPQSTAQPAQTSSSSGDVDIDALLSLTGPLSPLPESAATSSTLDDDKDDLLTFDLNEILGPAVEDPFAQSARQQRTAEPEFDLDEGVPAIPDMYEPGAGDLTSIFAETEVEDYEPREPQEEQLEPALPDWVTDLKPSEGPVVINIVDQEVRFTDKPLVQVPEQLRALRERSKRVADKRRTDAAAKVEMPTAAPLAGLSDTIDIVPESVQPRFVIGDAAPLIVSDLDARRIRIIQNILGAEEKMLRDRALAEDEREEKQAHEAIAPKVLNRAKLKVDRFIVSLLLAAALVLPFFSNVANITPPPDVMQLSQEGQKALLDVGGVVDSLQTGQPVLVAFEYGPTGAGELDDMALALLTDITSKGAQPVIVSTNPSGALHAQTLMQNFSLAIRKDYYVLGYLPGGAVGVRALTNALMSEDLSALNVQTTFKTDIEGKESGLTDISIATLRSSPAFILTEAPEDVRDWVEQYRSEPPRDTLKIVLFSSAAASAVAQTYVSSEGGRVVGPLVGLHNALVYRATRPNLALQGRDQVFATQRWNSIALAALLAAVIILFGAIIAPIRSLFTTRRVRR